MMYLEILLTLYTVVYIIVKRHQWKLHTPSQQHLESQLLHSQSWSCLQSVTLGFSPQELFINKVFEITKIWSEKKKFWRLFFPMHFFQVSRYLITKKSNWQGRIEAPTRQLKVIFRLKITDLSFFWSDLCIIKISIKKIIKIFSVAIFKFLLSCFRTPALSQE